MMLSSSLSSMRSTKPKPAMMMSKKATMGLQQQRHRAGRIAAKADASDPFDTHRFLPIKEHEVSRAMSRKSISNDPRRINNTG